MSAKKSAEALLHAYCKEVNHYDKEIANMHVSIHNMQSEIYKAFKDYNELCKKREYLKGKIVAYENSFGLEISKIYNINLGNLK